METVGGALLWIVTLAIIVRLCVSTLSPVERLSIAAKLGIALAAAFLFGPGIALLRDWGGLAPPVVTVAMGLMGQGWVPDVIPINVACWAVTSVIVFALMPSARPRRGADS